MRAETLRNTETLRNVSTEIIGEKKVQILDF